MRVRWALGAALAIGMAAPACDSDEDQIVGTYELRIIENRDTCDGELNQVGSTVTITRSATGFVLDFGDEARLDGTISDQDVLVASGDIVLERNGVEIPAFLQIGLVIREGQIRQGTGRLRFNGTFPGVPGVCEQEFTVRGSRQDSRVPVVG